MNGTRTCSVPGCDRKHDCNGLCHVHDLRMRRYGSVESHAPLIPSPEARLAAGLSLMPNGCIEWSRGTDRNGYGVISVNGKNRYTHRYAWELAHGPIPDGLYVLHHCDNPPCGNTAHLFLGTDMDNMADRRAKGRHGNQKKTHCIHGHEFTTDNTRVSAKGWRSCIECQHKREHDHRSRHRSAA